MRSRQPKLEYVQIVTVKRRKYYYFRNRNTKTRIKLDGVPGSREFEESYREALRVYAPPKAKLELSVARGAMPGSMAWVIEQYKARSKQWANAVASTREIYDRRHHWIAAQFGEILIWTFTRVDAKRIRDMAEFADKRSVADATIDRLAALWRFAEEFCDLPELIRLNGINPFKNIVKLTSDDDTESAPVWPSDLCLKVERYAPPDVKTFYYLARYTGQRRSDLATMKWEHIDWTNNMMFVAQLKTRARIWVPLPSRLRDYLVGLKRRGEYIVPSPKKKGEPWAATSITNEIIATTKGLDYEATDSKGEVRYYSPHGLRHLCGIELAHAGASDEQIAAVLGHSTLKQVRVYTKQANQILLARGAQKLRDEMYRRQLHDLSINAATNVTKLRA